ncbi:MAG: DUF4340 domain-containing protein [Patescibacteria group bacterium]|jgi:hypothetical protein
MKKNLYLLILLIILAGGAYLYEGPFQKWNESRKAPKNFLNTINFESADKIEIIRTEKTEVLNKDGERWKLDDGKFYASSEAVSALKESFQKAQSSRFEIASANKEKKGDFDLTKEFGTEVRMSSGGKAIGDFLIGKLTSDYMGSYISQPDSADSYMLPVALASAFSPYEWRDLSIFKISKEKIEKLRFQYPDRELKFEKKDGGWQVVSPEKFKAEDTAVDEALAALAGLNAEAIPAQSFSGTDLEKHLIIVEAQGSEGNFTLMIGKDNGRGQYYAKRGDSENVYLIGKANRDLFDKKIGDFK